MLPGPTLDISSSAIRQWLSQGHTPDFLVPEKVLEYIRQHHLYQPQ
jgi:nicotinate-nucleotide adenylyltransferase